MTDHTKLAELLGSIGWNSPNDAQWERLEEAMPEIEALFEAPVEEGYLGTVQRLEPKIHVIDAGAFYASAAISLRRIADCFEEVLRRAPT